jgi:hypothetical protein
MKIGGGNPALRSPVLSSATLQNFNRIAAPAAIWGATSTQDIPNKI